MNIVKVEEYNTSNGAAPVVELFNNIVYAPNNPRLNIGESYGTINLSHNWLKSGYQDFYYQAPGSGNVVNKDGSTNITVSYTAAPGSTNRSASAIGKIPITVTINVPVLVTTVPFFMDKQIRP